MHSAQQSYDTNGWNSIQNGHAHYPQQMSYHYPQNRGTPSQIDTHAQSHSNPQIPIAINHHHAQINQMHHSHSNPHPQSIPIAHKSYRGHSHGHNHNHNPKTNQIASRPTRTASYSSGFNDYRPIATKGNMQFTHQMPQISEPRSDANHYNNYRRSNPQTRSNQPQAIPQQPHNHKTRTQSVNSASGYNANQLPAPAMQAMHKFPSNDSSNHSIYSPESIRSQPAPQREAAPIHDMKKNKSFTLYHDEAPKTKQSRSRTLTSIRGLNTNSGAWNHNHNNRHNQVKSEIMVFSPKNNELNLPNNIGLADYKQSDYVDMEREYYNKQQEPKRRRAETAPAPPYYGGGFMRSVDENLEYLGSPRNNQAHPVQHLPIASASYIGSPINMFSPTRSSPTPPHHITAQQQQQQQQYHRQQMQQYNNAMQYRNPPRLLASVTSQHQATEESYSSETVSDESYSSESMSSSDSSDSHSVYSDESGSSISESSYSDSRSLTQSSQESESLVSASKTPRRKRKRKRKQRSRKKRQQKKKSAKRSKQTKQKKKTKRGQKPHMKDRKSTKRKAKDPHGSGYIVNNHHNHHQHHKTHHDHHKKEENHMKREREKSNEKKNKIASHLMLTGNKREYEKSKKTAILLRSVLKRQMLFIGLDDVMIDSLVDEMYQIKCVKNECLTQQNEIGSALFVIESGKFIQIRNNKVIAFASAKSMVGEASLLYSQTRRVTLKAQSDSVAWALDKKEFMKLRQSLTAKNIKSHLKKVKFLRKIELFGDMHTMDLVDVASAIRAILYRKGANIITEGEESTHFFIVYKGSCEAFEIDKDTKNPKKRLYKYTGGHYFGASGIINKELRKLRVTATSDDVICYVLNAVEFLKFLNPKSKCRKYSAPSQMTTKFVNKLGIKSKLADFQHIAQIGCGEFGEICLVQNEESGETYALKRIEKYKVIKKNAIQHIRNERAILSILNNNLFIVQLCATFSDERNVYLLQEAVLGGQVFYLLKFNKRFPEKTARFYAACVVLAFEHIHSKNVIYRDLKAQNLLVSHNGYIKLIDFVCAKQRNDTCTLCGTLAEYLAPEVIQCAHESFTTDWWTLGVFIYEMLIGAVPFRDDANVKMYEKILSSSVDFPSKIKVSRTGKDLITSLLRKHPYKRLGSGLNGHQQIKNHQWFQAGFNWNKMEKQQIKPPYFPNIANKKDITNFERFEFDPKQVQNNMHSVDNLDPSLVSWCDEF